MDEPATFTSTIVPGPILTTLVDYLPFASIRALQLTCRQYGNLYQYALPTKWSVDRHLSRWFQHPTAFRQALQENQGLVAGSAALQFFAQPTTWQPADIDVYVHARDAERMHTHLLDTQGCVFTTTLTGQATKYPVYTIREVRCYTCLSVRTRELEHIQLIVIAPRYCTDDLNVNYHKPHAVLETILEEFHSTVVMNMLMGSEAISLFPQPTFVHRKNYMCNNRNDSKQRGVDKYVERGWSFTELFARDRHKVGNPIRRARMFGDEYCWRIGYDSSGISRLPSTNHAGHWWTMKEVQYEVYHPAETEPEYYPASTTRVRAYHIQFEGWLKDVGHIADRVALQKLVVAALTLYG